MLKAFIFIIKYKILKDPINLSLHTKEFFKLSKNTQRKVLNKYFDKIDSNVDIVGYFNTKESRYYDDGEEVTFFNCYYFDKLILEHDIKNIKFIDRFKLDSEKINYLIGYSLEIIEEDKLEVRANDLVNYNDELPIRLSKNIMFMKYLIDKNYINIKYLTYNELSPTKQRDLIKESIIRIKKDNCKVEKFLKRDKELPSILSNNLDFILYLIDNDINNVKYLSSKFINSLTSKEINSLINKIIGSLKSNEDIEYIESNVDLAIYLNRNTGYIKYIIDKDIDNIKYIDWHNLIDDIRDSIINYIANRIKKLEIKFDVMNYPFRDIFFQNYAFMEYLINKDFRWIAVNSVNDKNSNDKLIEMFFEKIKTRKYKFKLTDFLEDGEYLNYNLITNKKMLHYLFENKVALVQHINFFNLKNSRSFVDNLVDELEKTGIDYNFCNDDFLINGRYPVVLSNNYRFMRFVIDKNFNHIAYIDTSMIDKRELKRIINYAFRMVYYIRGKNKNLSFDFEGYFNNSMIIDNDYFKECLRSL